MDLIISSPNDQAVLLAHRTHRTTETVVSKGACVAMQCDFEVADLADLFRDELLRLAHRVRSDCYVSDGP